MLLKTKGKKYEELLIDVKGKSFTREELEVFTRRLARLGGVIHNFYSKQKGKEPRFIL